MKERLYRSRNRVIGGVSAGLGEYLNIDPVIVRVPFYRFYFNKRLGTSSLYHTLDYRPRRTASGKQRIISRNGGRRNN